MLAKQVKPLLSEDDYLEMEKVSKIRHEYVEGTIYAMAGGSRSHNKIAMNIGSALHQHVKGTGCDVYMSDVKLKIAHRRSYYYPDLMLGCSREETNEYFLTQPCLIIAWIQVINAIPEFMRLCVQLVQKTRHEVFGNLTLFEVGG